MKLYILDRIEGDFALLEDSDTGKMNPVPLGQLPAPLQEGDCLVEENGTFQVDPERTRQRREEVLQRLKRLKKQGHS